MSVSGGMLSALSDGLAELYAPASGEEWPARVARAVSRLIPADSCSYNRFSGRTPLAWYVEPAEDEPLPEAARLFREHVPDHPLLAHQQATGDTEARRISDFLSDREFRSLGLYQEFYRLREVRYQLAVGIPAGDGTLMAVALNRWQHDFTDDERDAFNLIRPHIAQAADLALLLSLPGAPRRGDPDAYARLTAQQSRILQLVADGYPDRGIAQILGISIRTVQAHLQRAYRALDVSSRTEALARLPLWQRSLPLVTGVADDHHGGGDRARAHERTSGKP
jgi:DNA-binding CsgD family transcriptional regulator